MCPQYWYGYDGNCYYNSYGEHHWNNSRTQCQNLGGELAVPENQDQLVRTATRSNLPLSQGIRRKHPLPQDFLYKQFPQTSIWLGLSRPEEQGSQWFGIDNASVEPWSVPERTPSPTQRASELNPLLAAGSRSEESVSAAI